MTVSADGRYLYVNASLEPAVRRFAIAADGSLSASTVIARPALPPDGMSAVDAEGGFWVADPEGHAALRIGPNAEITHRVETDRKCLAVALGGQHGRTLFLCTTISSDEHESAAQRASRIEFTELR